ncbi:MAG: dienelactone hydrolase family protein [Candidatus Binataceae bacterium]
MLASPAAKADWQRGEFQSDGKPVTEYHCAPSSPGPHPAVILLHGGAPQGADGSAFEDMCDKIAQAGYFAEFIEYYSQTGGLGPFSPSGPVLNFPIFEREIESGIDALDKNPAVDPSRLGIMGFSLGADLALAVAAQEPDKVAALVEYYGVLPPELEANARNLPATLILHGSADMVVPVSNAHKLDALMTDAGRPHEMHIYPGLGHGFNFLGSSDRDSWERSVQFLDEHLRSQPEGPSQSPSSSP